MSTLAKVCRYLYDSPDRVAPYVPPTCPRARQSRAYHIGYMEGRAEGMREAAAYVAQWARSGLAHRVWEALAPTTAIGSVGQREGLASQLVRSIVGGNLGSLVPGGVPSPETKGHDPALYQSTAPKSGLARRLQRIRGMTRYVVRLKARETGALIDVAVKATESEARDAIAKAEGYHPQQWVPGAGRIVKVQAAQALQRRFRR